MITTINYHDVNFIWISCHYDIHLKGLCLYDNKLCRFEVNYNSPEKCEIYSLTILEKIKWSLNKKLFEWCIGYHWTYPLGRSFGKRSPKWFWNKIFFIYYKSRILLKG